MYLPLDNYILPKDIKPETKDGYTSDLGFEVLKKKLTWHVEQYVNTFKVNYEDFLDIEGQLTLKLSLDERNGYYSISAVFDDGKVFISDDVRNEYNEALKERTPESIAKMRYLVKHKQKLYQPAAKTQGETNDK